MKRRACCILSFALLVSAFRTSEAKLIKGPYLQWLTTDGVTVMWEPDDAAPAVVEYGPEGQWTGKIEVKQGKAIQEARLTGLQPETTYQYRVVVGSHTAGPFTFRTAVGPRSPYRFAVYSDTHRNTETHRALVEAMAKHRPAFILHAGDRVSRGEKPAEWGSCFFEPLAGFNCSIPIFPAMGNHDGPGDLHRAFFSPPAGRLHYAFPFGNGKFIVVDSCSPESTWLEKDPEQGRWLAHELKQDGYTWTVVVFHVPPYSSHPERGCNLRCQQVLCPILERGRVDLVFNGHNHCYERIYPMRNGRRDDVDGVPYIITGGGGGTTYPVLGDSFTAAFESVHHYCLVDVSGPLMTVTAYTADGRVIDRFGLCKDVGCLTKLADQARSAGGAARVEMGERLSLFFSIQMPAILEPFAADPDPAVRRAVAGGLGRLAMPAGRSVALKLSRDSDAGVRRGAALAIARTSTGEQLQEIRDLLTDADGGVRRNAAWFFVHQSGPKVAELAGAALNDSEVDVRRRAIRGLRDVHDESIISALAKAVSDADAGVALPAVNHAIQDNRTVALAEGLARASRHNDPDVRLAAVKGLASSKNPRVAVPALIDRLADEDANTRGAALGTLEGMTGKEFGYDLAQWRKWWEEQPH